MPQRNMVAYRSFYRLSHEDRLAEPLRANVSLIMFN